jgi:hypothetical protein
VRRGPGSPIQFDGAAEAQAFHQREDAEAILVGQIGEVLDQLARILG